MVNIIKIDKDVFDDAIIEIINEDLEKKTTSTARYIAHRALDQAQVKELESVGEMVKIKAEIITCNLFERTLTFEVSEKEWDGIGIKGANCALSEIYSPNFVRSKKAIEEEGK